ncbi:hypothetical protein [Lactobacillus sp. ESL0260]|uniref:hypothetical protein n=1 Tax=Lactobacillus sp. ESL0260 TaxID=2069347 RepID=UPI0011C3B81B|nr:hypothetical protein [Lactobacillus sp. ESL0260]
MIRISTFGVIVLGRKILTNLLEGKEREKLRKDLVQELKLTNLAVVDINNKAEELDSYFSEIKNIVVSPGAGVIQLHRNSLNPENIDSLTAQNNDVSPMQMNGNGLEFIGPNGFYSAITKGRVVGNLLEGVMLRLWKLMHCGLMVPWFQPLLEAQ